MPVTTGKFGRPTHYGMPPGRAPLPLKTAVPRSFLCGAPPCCSPLARGRAGEAGKSAEAAANVILQSAKPGVQWKKSRAPDRAPGRRAVPYDLSCSSICTGGRRRQPAASVFHHLPGGGARHAGRYRPDRRRHLPGVGQPPQRRAGEQSAHPLLQCPRRTPGHQRRRGAGRLAALAGPGLARPGGQRAVRQLQPLRGRDLWRLVRRPGPDPPHRRGVLERHGAVRGSLAAGAAGPARRAAADDALVCPGGGRTHRLLCGFRRRGPRRRLCRDQRAAVLLFPAADRGGVSDRARADHLPGGHAVGAAHRLPGRRHRPALEQGLDH